MSDVIAHRACPLCEAICGLQLKYVDGVLTSIRGDDADTFSRGHLCPKGVAILDLESDPDRVRAPMRKVEGGWREATWDEAFAEIGQRLHAIQSQHGRDAVAVYLGNPNVHHFSLMAHVPQLLRAIGSRNSFSASSVDQWPHQLVNWQMYGHQWLLPIPDLDRLDVLLMLGANPVASNGSLMTAPDVTVRLKAIRARGALIVVDPRRSETAAIASEHLAIRPGGDVWFLIALLQALARLGAPRLDAYAGKLDGFDVAMARVQAVRIDDLAQRTGIAMAQVEAVAAQLHRVTNACVYGRMGVSTQRFGTVAHYLIQLVNLHLGQLDRAGGCLPNEAIVPVTGPGTSKGSRGRWSSRVRGLPELCGELPVAVLREEIETPGAGQVRALLTVAGNPVASTPNGAALDRALATLEFQVAIDPYLNETTRHADWILPPPSFLAEDHYDLYFNAFAIRRVARLSVPTQPLPEGARAQWQILDGVVRGLRGARGEPHTPFLPPREVLAALLARGGSGLTLDDLLAAPHGLDLGPLAPSLLRRLETSSGAIECAPPLLLDLFDAAVNEVDRVEAGFDLRLIGRRHVRSNNSWMHNAQRLVKGKPRHQLLMHPDDLAARGLADGARVRVGSRVGAVVVDVQSDADLQRGVVSLPHGFGQRRDGVRLGRAASLDGVSVNDLTDDAWLDSGTGNAALNGVPVRVERLDRDWK
ncbi:MAG TPA: molybdopterin-dependent oxidoreductase [Patescibacteria group bacterium]|nr:molybdopterin-dependent oxidoreductase [Patescibacteria group bacterium]